MCLARHAITLLQKLMMLNTTGKKSRNSTSATAEAGSVWWVQALVALSHTRTATSSTFRSGSWPFCYSREQHLLHYSNSHDTNRSVLVSFTICYCT
eukprot:c23890_g4_i3 orf=355-642(-)